MTAYTLTLLWRCSECGWEQAVEAPGFAGDGRFHYPDGRTACGPISAQRDLHCGAVMDGLYGALSRCARPEGHFGAHDSVWHRPKDNL